MIVVIELITFFQAFLNKSSSTPSGEQFQGKSDKQKEILYTQALDELIQFRRDISEQSFHRSHERILGMKRIREDDNLQSMENLSVYRLYQHNKELVLNLSQFGDERPLSIVRYNKDGNLFASGSFSPLIKIWDSASLSNLKVLRGHGDRVTGLTWRKNDGSMLLGSSSADGTCLVWNLSSLENRSDSEMVVDGENDKGPSLLKQKFKDHKAIVGGCDFHPFANVIGTACHDNTWRLFDIETAQEILMQDGHTKECSSIAFHPDGSLVFTTDFGGVGLLWDLRSGQMIQGFPGHIKRINHSCFSSNGFHVATSSVDNTVKIWDLRKKKCHYTLPAHSNVISDVAYSSSGELLLTASFDGSLKMWNTRNFGILRTLSGHSGKVMSCDFHPDERHVISAGYDRTLKLWAHKEEF